jgi:hypothetical protein
MATNLKKLIGLTTLAALTPFSLAGGQALSPREALLRSMQRVFPVNVAAIIVQRDPANEGTYQTVRVERDRGGRVHHTILQPLRLAGVESVDDGERSKIYFPDRNLLIDQDSPQQSPCDADWRINLASQNYSFKFGEPVRIAGRNTLCVTAVPRNSAMDVRRYYIDERTYYPLRLESVADNGARTVFYDTKDIRYLASIGASRFKLQPVGTPQTLVYSKPPTLNSRSAYTKMGFQPLMPVNMPMGFRLQEMQLSEAGRWKSVALRISDGLVRATVYQWLARGSNFNVKSIENSTPAEYRGVRLLLVSDLSPRLREQLLSAFIERAEAQPQVLLRIAQTQSPTDPLGLEPTTLVPTLTRVETLRAIGIEARKPQSPREPAAIGGSLLRRH